MKPHVVNCRFNEGKKEGIILSLNRSISHCLVHKLVFDQVKTQLLSSFLPKKQNKFKIGVAWRMKEKVTPQS